MARYPCNKLVASSHCDYHATSKSSRGKHIQSVHEGIKYPCPQCDYQAPLKGALRRHIQSTHEGIKYPCPFCDYQATQRVHLKTHKE